MAIQNIDLVTNVLRDVGVKVTPTVQLVSGARVAPQGAAVPAVAYENGALFAGQPTLNVAARDVLVRVIMTVAD